MKKQKQPEGDKSNEVTRIKNIKNWSKIATGINKADQLIFELKKMVYRYCGNVELELADKETDFQHISTMYHKFLKKRAESLASITKILTKEY